jgi:molybdopterin adenylyltransferase
VTAGDPGPGGGRRATVITVSDGVASGTRLDASGDRLSRRLTELGFRVDRTLVPDEIERIASALTAATEASSLVVTTGGTGLTPRDVTPQATATVLDYEVPGLAELIRAEGRRSTPMAALSRGVVGVRHRTLVVNVPGSPGGAAESLEAIVPVLGHALETLEGPYDHGTPGGPGQPEPGRS